MKKNKYYAYYIPSTDVRGTTDSWKECEELVSGKPNARYKGFKIKKEAEEWLKIGADYSFKKKVKSGIYFDAGTGRGQGVEVSVTDENGKNLLSEVMPKKNLNKFGKHVLAGDLTNNYGELMGYKFALEIALKKKIKKVFGDSKLVINYWSRGFVKKESFSRELLELIDEVIALKNKFEKKGGILIYISGENNPADLGFHR